MQQLRYTSVSLKPKQHPATASLIFYVPNSVAHRALNRRVRSVKSLGVLASGNAPAVLGGESTPTFIGGSSFSKPKEGIMPKISHAQIEQTQLTTNSNSATPMIEGRESASIYGIASLELTCTECTVADVVHRRDEIMASIRSVATQARGIIDLTKYAPQRNSLEFFMTMLKPYSFGISIDVMAVSNDEIMADADFIMRRLIHDFKLLDNLKMQGRRNG